jgi:hypothetical protein
LISATAIIPPRSRSRHHPDWQAGAACAGADPSLFHGPRSGTGGWRPYCARCPVADVCLYYALVCEADAAGRHGIWGGTTPATRQRIAAALAGVNLTESYHAALEAWDAPGGQSSGDDLCVAI